jgi:hypothetical protein
MAQVEEYTIDLATIGLVGSVVPLVPAGREFTDVYIAEAAAGLPIMLMIGLTAAAGFRNIVTGDSFDCWNKRTCKGETDGIGVKVLTLTGGTFRIAVTYASDTGGAAGTG